MEDLKNILFEYEGKLTNTHTKEDLDSLKTLLFGKNGKINELFKKLSSMDEQKKKDYASQLNNLKNEIA